MFEARPSKGYELNGFKTVFLDRRLSLVDRSPLWRLVRISSQIRIFAR